MSSTTLYLKKVDPRAEIPQQSRNGDVGLDLKCLDDFEIPPGKVTKVKTGLMFSKHPRSGLGGVFMKIEDRSSMALKGIFSHGGIIDPNYRSEFHVILYNSSDKTYQGKAGDKIAQGVIYPAAFTDIMSCLKCEEDNEVDETQRGTGGFGSTGR